MPSLLRRALAATALLGILGVAPFSPPPAELFSDGFESGDYTAWSSYNDGNGQMTLSAACALQGSYGLCIPSTNNSRKQMIDLSPADETLYSASFLLDPNGISLTGADRIRIFQGRNDATFPFILLLRKTASGFQLRLRVSNDSLAYSDSAWQPITDALHEIAVEWQADSAEGAGDGYGKLFVDDVLVELVTAVDNNTMRIDGIRLGITSRMDGITLQGQLRMDDFHSIQWAHPGPRIAGCPLFPADSIWNARVDSLPVHPNSDAYVQTIGADEHVHADFGSGEWDGGPIGIPYTLIDGSQPMVPISFYYDDQSDPGPYPIPPDALIEGGPDSDGDRHILLVDTDNCVLYEIFDAWPQGDGSWDAGSGAYFDLNSHALRPETWTSADAAGLSILAGLARYDEIEAGEIRHALRFTAPETRNAYLWPARHYASDLSGAQYPPMGLRFRLKADYDISGFSPEVQIILIALKRYGMILADNGSPWYISGVPGEGWDNDALHALHGIFGSAFEAVDVSGLMFLPDFGLALFP